MDERLSVLSSNEEFKSKLVALETVEQIQALFNEYEIEMSQDEVAEFCKEVAKAANLLPEGEELNEEELENVAGGIVITASVALTYAAYAGALALGAYLGYQRAKRK